MGMLAKLDLSEISFLHPGIPTTRIFWPYLLSSLLIAFVIFLIKRDRKQRLSLKKFLEFSFPASIYKHKSALVDYLYFFFNQFVHSLLFLPFILSAPLISGFVMVSAHRLFGNPTFHVTPNFGINLAVTLFAAVLTDFSQYIAHYANHRVAFLWNFHKVHHSAEVLTPITVYRAHPVELFINANLIALSTGLVFGIFNYLATDPLGPVMILKVNVVIFLFNIVGSNLRHSHIWIPYPRWLSRILISPAQHQVHHSLDPAHFDKNFGSVFAIWDLIFKTLYIPKKKENFAIGLPNEEHKNYSGLFRLYFQPVKENFRLLFKRKPFASGINEFASSGGKSFAEPKS